MKPPTVKVSFAPADWKTRALRAEAALSKINASLDIAEEQLAGVNLRFDQRTALISIVQNGRELRFGFVRNKQVFYIEVYALMGADVAGWKKALLE